MEDADTKLLLTGSNVKIERLKSYLKTKKRNLLFFDNLKLITEYIKRFKIRSALIIAGLNSGEIVLAKPEIKYLVDKSNSSIKLVIVNDGLSPAEINQLHELGAYKYFIGRYTSASSLSNMIDAYFSQSSS